MSEELSRQEILERFVALGINHVALETKLADLERERGEGLNESGPEIRRLGGTMRKTTIIALVLLLTTVVFAAPTAPPARAAICFNEVVHRGEVKLARLRAYWAGCQTSHATQVSETHYLVYGVNVYIGE
jgi:hypothetical protein